MVRPVRFVKVVCAECGNYIGIPEGTQAWCWGSLVNDSRRHARRVMRRVKGQ